MERGRRTHITCTVQHDLVTVTDEPNKFLCESGGWPWFGIVFEVVEM